MEKRADADSHVAVVAVVFAHLASICSSANGSSIKVSKRESWKYSQTLTYSDKRNKRQTNKVEAWSRAYFNRSAGYAYFCPLLNRIHFTVRCVQRVDVRSLYALDDTFSWIHACHIYTYTVECSGGKGRILSCLSLKVDLAGTNYKGEYRDASLSRFHIFRFSSSLHMSHLSHMNTAPFRGLKHLAIVRASRTRSARPSPVCRHQYFM